MKHYSFKTATIQIDTSIATTLPEAPQYPYITYRCRSPIDLNFLLREFVEYQDQIRTIPTYPSTTDATSASLTERTQDLSNTLGMAYCLRLLGAVTLGPLPPTEAEALDLEVLSYGPTIPSTQIGWQSYRDGIPPEPQSVASEDPAIATMDLGEFFQVALSAIRNKSRDAPTTARRGLSDRESINSAAVAQDIGNRSILTPRASDLLWPLLRSSAETAYATGAPQSLVGTSENWIKNIVYQIIRTQDPDSIERYLRIRPIGCPSSVRAICPRLIDGDAIVIVMQIRLSKQDGTKVPNDCPDYPGIPMTIGYRIEHQGPYTVPVGWELANIPPGTPCDLRVDISPANYHLMTQWHPPEGFVGSNLEYVVSIYDTRTLTRRTQVTRDLIVDMGQVSPATKILVTVFARSLIGDSDVSGQPATAESMSPPLPAVPNWSGYLAESLAGMFLAVPPMHGLFVGKYSLLVGPGRTHTGVGNSFSVSAKDLFRGASGPLDVRLAAIYLVGGREFIGPYGDPIVLTPPRRDTECHPHCNLPIRWRSDVGCCDVVVTSGCDASITLCGEVRDVVAGDFVTFRGVKEGEHTLYIWSDGEVGTKKCIVMRNIATSG